MEEHTITYKKFPAKNRKFIGHDRLWFGEDHLLLVASTGISEDYKRFYFKDIQAINVMKTKTHMIYIIIGFILIGLIGALTALAYSQSNHDPTTLIFGSIISPIILFYIIWHFIKGPSCKCFMYSSVQKENLTPVNTLKKARLFFTTITHKIEASQGVLAPEILKANTQRLVAPTSAVSKHTDHSSKKKISPAWHRTLFLSLICLSVFMTATLIYRLPLLFTANGLILLLTLLIGTIAVIKQTGSVISGSIKTISITSLILLIMTIVCGYAEFIFFLTTNVEKWAKASQNQWELTKLFAQIDPFDYPIILGVDIFFITAFLIIGLSGLFLCWRQDK